VQAVLGASLAIAALRSIDGIDPTGKSIAECLGLFKGSEGAIVRLEVVDKDGNLKAMEITRTKFFIEG
jgi:hypothetical protein